MVKRLRTHFATDSGKRYYITGAPQCPFPDAMMGAALDDVGFDAVFVQFYNNFCATASNGFNFKTWDTWAKETSPNKDVKVLIGIPGSHAAAGSGYVPFDQLEPIVQNVHNIYSSFGGVMLWGNVFF
jgi:chitinase